MDFSHSELHFVLKAIQAVPYKRKRTKQKVQNRKVAVKTEDREADKTHSKKTERLQTA